MIRPSLATLLSCSIAMAAATSAISASRLAGDAGPERLILIGGGPNRPPAALQQFVHWAGDDRAGILVITWASQIPDEAFRSIANDLQGFRPGSIQIAANPPKTPKEYATFLRQLKECTGVFFSGGDQNRIMDTLQGEWGERVRRELTRLYAHGRPFIGTSAGTAIMSPRMISGDPVAGSTPTRVGLGFLPEDAVVDQHFIQRKRNARLRSAQRSQPGSFAIGIDEDTALILENKKSARVAGAGKVRIITERPDGRYREVKLGDGDRFDLENKIRVGCLGSRLAQ